MVAAKVDAAGQAEVRLSRQQLAEQAQREIDEAFREWQPPRHVEERSHRTTDARTLDEFPADGRVIEHRSSPAQDGGRSEPVAEADGPALPVARDFARPSSFEAVPYVARQLYAGVPAQWGAAGQG
jgi:hypothetical protein